MAQPHDHLFQTLFADPEHAAPLLRSSLPAEISAEIDWASLQRCSPVQRAARGRQSVCDLLFSVRVTASDHGLLLYVVLEHKSQSGRFDALQLLEQVVAVLRTHRREHPEDRYLPAVLPIVVHADHRPWRSPRNLLGLFDLDSLPPGLSRYLPRFEYLLDDLHDKPPQHLRDRALSVFGLCALSALQYLPPAARDLGAFARWVREWCDVHELAQRIVSTSGRDAYEAVVHYILEAPDLPDADFRRVLRNHLSEPAMNNFLSVKDQIRAEGRNEGLNEGLVEGHANLLLRQLRKRFGADQAAAAEPRLREASIEQLEQFGERLLEADCIEDVFR